MESPDRVREGPGNLSRIASNDRAHAGCGVHLDLVMHDLSSRFTRDRIESAVAFLASEGIL